MVFKTTNPLGRPLWFDTDTPDSNSNRYISEDLAHLYVKVPRTLFMPAALFHHCFLGNKSNN